MEPTTAPVVQEHATQIGMTLTKVILTPVLLQWDVSTRMIAHKQPGLIRVYRIQVGGNFKDGIVNTQIRK